MTLLPPTEKQLQVMEEELYQDPAVTGQDVVRLREWLKKQPHLPKHMDDVRLERFLYGCKFSVERAKRVLETYYTVRTAIPEFFANRDPLAEDLQTTFKCTQYFPLPSLTPAGYRVTIFRLADTNLDYYSAEAITKRIIMTLDLRLLEESCLNNVMIFDLAGFTAGHFAVSSPVLTVIRRAMLCIQDAFPMRMAVVHLINAPALFSKMRAIYVSLFKEKLVQKLIVYSGGFENLHKFIPKEVLPCDYGGEAGTMQELNNVWIKKLMDHRDWFLEESRFSKSDESRRPSKCASLTSMSLAEVHGTYKKIIID